MINAQKGLPMPVDLSGDWAFAYQPPDAAPPDIMPAPGEFAAAMPAPGNWDDHLDRLRRLTSWSKARFNPDYRPVEFPMGTHPPNTTLPYLLGTGWYRRTVKIDGLDRHSRVMLTVGGVVGEGWVWLNGRCLAHQTTHRLPFTVRLDPWVKPGANDLVLAVSNLAHDKESCDLRGYAGYSAGICGPVTLKITRQALLENFYLQPAAGGRAIQWQVDVAGAGEARNLQTRYRLAEWNSGRTVLDGAALARGRTARWTTSAQDVICWSDRDPRLYRAICELWRENELLDQVEQPFGLRLLERRGNQLFLNGQPLYLRGMCEHGYFPLTTTPPLDQAFYLENCRKLKELGYNWIRFHTWVPGEAYLKAADEAGMLVQLEAYHGFDAADWRRILRHGRTHPAVVLYACGNEECIDAPRLKMLRRMAVIARREAPDALFNPQSALRGVEYGDPAHLGPGAVARPYPHHPGKLAQLKKFADVFAPYCWGMLSYTHSISRGDRRVIDRRLKAYQRPCLAHEIGITGTYLDLDLENRYAGTRIGTALYATACRYLARAGLLSRAARYYRNSCAWARLLYKYNLETARMCQTVSGYDHLGAYDHHWHRYGYPCGVMNEFYEIKPGESAENFRRSNGESALLLDAGPRRNFNAGAAAAWDLHVSWFAPARVKNGLVEWRLADDAGLTRARGTLPFRNLAPGQIRKLGTISLRMPEVSRAEHLTLHARLVAPEQELDNLWDFYVYPQPAGAPAVSLDGALLKKWRRFCQSEAGGRPAAIRIVPALTDAAMSHLRGGGVIILLGHNPFAALPTEFHSCSAGRALGNMATVIYDHPLTRDFPHAGWCGWQFYSMLEGGAAVVFDDLPMEFKPIIEVVSSFKLIVKQAALFECRMGAGRLLVCSLNLLPGDPGSVYLLGRMAAYAAGADFQPELSLDPDWLARRAPAGAINPEYTATDQAFDATLAARKA